MDRCLFLALDAKCPKHRLHQAIDKCCADNIVLPIRCVSGKGRLFILFSNSCRLSYPFQYLKRKIIRNSVCIALGAIEILKTLRSGI